MENKEYAESMTPLSDELERQRIELRQERTPAYGDALALCRRLERASHRQAPAASAAAGWQLVPKTLDANMHAAMDRAFTDAMHLGTPVSPDAWEAALASAPSPTVQKAPEQKLDNLLELIDTYAETRHTCGCKEYNVKTSEAYKAVRKALEGR